MTDLSLSETARQRIAEALEEDRGQADLTTEWTVGPEVRGAGEIVACANGVIAGLEAAAEVYRQLGDAQLDASVTDGATVGEGASIASVTGIARAILTGERLALNFLMRLSGVATLTRKFVDAIEGTGARITDTRKTTPLWRELERAATRVAGAINHRDRLDEMILIKDNHIACADGLQKAVARARRAEADHERGLEIEVEVTDMDEAREALTAGVDRIMLDNMSVDDVRRAVQLIRERAPGVAIEASGGVTLQTVRALAEAGVDYISVGALTHSAPALDLSLVMRSLR